MKLTSFKYRDKELPVTYVETQQVKDGVSCDVYEFSESTKRDLGIISLKAGCKTPLQVILKGKSTIEGYISGRGRIFTRDSAGNEQFYEFPNEVTDDITLSVGDTMQWIADDDMVLYEICEPPFKEGRFQNLD